MPDLNEIAQWIVLLIVSAYAGYVHWCQRKQIRKPLMPREYDADVATEWRAEMENHPVGSPKHTAFVNRLRELGHGD